MTGRTRKKLSLEDQLQQIDDKIAELQQKRITLLARKKDDSLKKLNDFLRENNLDPDDIRNYLFPEAVVASTTTAAEEV